jgi:8-oxo-dGTP diphosphatase
MIRLLFTRHAILPRSFHSTTIMAGNFTYKWARPALTVDAIIISHKNNTNLQTLLIQRKNDPFSLSWALPGGFVDENEPLHHAAARELQEETSLDPSDLNFTQIGAYGDPGRDPRGWTVGVAFACKVPSDKLMGKEIKAADDAKDAKWWDILELPSLAFDHGDMLIDTFERLAGQPATDAETAAVLLKARGRLIQAKTNTT